MWILTFPVGYAFSIFIGNEIISKVIDHFWILLREDWDKLSQDEKENKKFIKQTPNKKRIKVALGVAESILYTTAFVFGKPEWAGAWLTLKVAVSWKSFDQNSVYSSHNIFLLGNALVILFAFVGAKIALLGCGGKPLL